MTTEIHHEELLENQQILLKKVNDLTQENDLLKKQLEWLKKQLFGKKSERVVNSNQLLLFPEMEPLEKKEEEKSQKIAAHIRKNPRQTQIAIPDNLPVKREIIDLPENEKICLHTGLPLIKIGEEVTRKLVHQPGHFFIKEIIRLKYASTEKNETTEIKIASLPSSLLTRCYADESFLASIATWKFADHLPLYRQEELLAREMIHIPRQTLSNWINRAGLALKPLYASMKQAVLDSGNIFVDETPIDLLVPGRGSTKQAYIWVLCGGEKVPYFIYSFFENRNHCNAATLLKDYKGILHSDKYGAYQKMAQSKQIIWAPCYAHIRRAFFEAEGGDPEFRDWALRQIRYLFMLERVAWSRSSEERLKIRREKELPILNRLIEKIKDKMINGRLLPKSKLYKALGYTMSLVPYLRNYIEHPYARLDNNTAERAVRPIAIGRKNWLFVGSEGGGELSAIFFSLVQTCRNLNINPREYLEFVMKRIMDHPVNKLHELFPNQFKNLPSYQTMGAIASEAGDS